MQITAIEPYYDVGTATLSTANRNMTGQGGTQWLASVQPGDQVYGADGRMGGVVETINSNTSITLTKNWRGANQSAGVYTIFRVSDSVRVENFSQRLLNLLLGGNLTALGDLTLAQNKGIHGTGAGALGTHDLTPAARAILALAGSSGAKLPVVTGASAAALRDIVGTVSQSGGVPTGAIIERGSNANGNFVRFADGTQFCARTATVDLSLTSTQNFPMPASFASVWAGGAGAAAPGSSFFGSYITGVERAAVLLSNSQWAVRYVEAISANTINLTLMAFGRWY